MVVEARCGTCSRSSTRAGTTSKRTRPAASAAPTRERQPLTAWLRLQRACCRRCLLPLEGAPSPTTQPAGLLPPRPSPRQRRQRRNPLHHRLHHPLSPPPTPRRFARRHRPHQPTQSTPPSLQCPRRPSSRPRSSLPRARAHVPTATASDRSRRRARARARAPSRRGPTSSARPSITSRPPSPPRPPPPLPAARLSSAASRRAPSRGRASVACTLRTREV